MIKKYFSNLNLAKKIILVFLLLFLASLTNSIFINQIGYFIPLIILVYLSIIKKEKSFHKNGLELAFILFIAAEIISAILSVDQSSAFNNLLKRFLLIPIVYTIANAADDMEKAKLFFRVYIGAAFITMMVYIVLAYKHFIAQLYIIELKGPSPFQYVMTAGGLMSFTTIFFFALLVNEKTNKAKKAFYLLAFSISSIALFASYTRAAWLGALAGLLTIIIIKRQWLILIPGTVLVLTVILFFKGESKIYKYVISNNNLKLTGVIETDGKVIRVIKDNDCLLAADYQNGVAVFENGKQTQRIETPAPATQVKRWIGNYFIAYLVDSRILILEKNSDGKIQIAGTFSSPGKTLDFKTANNKFYVTDEDSGLTIFQSPLILRQKINIKSVEHVNSFDCDSTYFAAYSSKNHLLKLYMNRDGIPVELIDSIDTKSVIGSVWLFKNRIYFQALDKFTQYLIADNKIRKLGVQNLTGIMKILITDSLLTAFSLDGKVFTSAKNFLHLNEFKQFGSLGYSPMDIIFENDSFYIAFNKRNRLTSIYDPYHETNIERLNIWRTGIKIFNEHPIFGVGDIDLGKLYSQFKDKYLKENFGHMHNNFIHFLVILGVIGFSAVMFLLCKILLLHIKIYRAVKDVPLVSSFSLGAVASFIGFIFSGIGEWNFGDHEIITMVWFILGLNIAFYNSYMKEMGEANAAK